MVTDPHRLPGPALRRLGYPGPHTAEADATKRMGSMVPSADIASLTQLRTDGSPAMSFSSRQGGTCTSDASAGRLDFPYDPR